MRQKVILLHTWSASVCAYAVSDINYSQMFFTRKFLPTNFETKNSDVWLCRGRFISMAQLMISRNFTKWRNYQHICKFLMNSLLPHNERARSRERVSPSANASVSTTAAETSIFCWGCHMANHILCWPIVFALAHTAVLITINSAEFCKI